MSEAVDEEEYEEEEYGEEIDGDDNSCNDFMTEQHLKGKHVTSESIDYDVLKQDLGEMAREREEMVENFLSDFKPEYDPESYNAWPEERLSGRATKVIKSEVMGFNDDEFDNHAEDEDDAEHVIEHTRNRLDDPNPDFSEDEDEESEVKRFIHDRSLVEHKEELLECMNMRKPKVLELAVNCFNAVQDKAALRLQSM